MGLPFRWRTRRFRLFHLPAKPATLGAAAPPGGGSAATGGAPAAAAGSAPTIKDSPVWLALKSGAVMPSTLAVLSALVEVFSCGVPVGWVRGFLGVENDVGKPCSASHAAVRISLMVFSSEMASAFVGLVVSTLFSGRSCSRNVSIISLDHSSGTTLLKQNISFDEYTLEQLEHEASGLRYLSPGTASVTRWNAAIAGNKRISFPPEAWMHELTPDHEAQNSPLFGPASTERGSFGVSSGEDGAVDGGGVLEPPPLDGSGSADNPSGEGRESSGSHNPLASSPKAAQRLFPGKDSSSSSSRKNKPRHQISFKHMLLKSNAVELAFQAIHQSQELKLALRPALFPPGGDEGARTSEGVSPAEGGETTSTGAVPETAPQSDIADDIGDRRSSEQLVTATGSGRSTEVAGGSGAPGAVGGPKRTEQLISAALLAEEKAFAEAFWLLLESVGLLVLQRGFSVRGDCRCRVGHD